MTTALTAGIESALSAHVGRPVRITGHETLTGGSINQVERIDSSAGSFVVKSSARPLPGMYQAEADGLGRLRKSGTRLTVPDVVAWSDGPEPFLLIEYLEPQARKPDFDDGLGHGLATLHRCAHARFGLDDDNYCGASAQPNTWTATWVTFYQTQRLGHQLQMAATRGLLHARERAQIENLIDQLGRWIEEPAEGASLLHGDLWSGNLIVGTRGEPALIDPAAYFGHREADLGMMTLFGGFPPRVFAAYEEAWPLEPGWRERLPLYQLYHLLNHLNLFGTSYHPAVMSVVRRFV